MFNNLTDLSYKRNFKEAFGFYISYLIFILVLAALFAIVLGIATRQTEEVVAHDFGFGVGVVVATSACLILSSLILRKKNLFKFPYILLVLLSGALAAVAGAVFGLIPVAYLSTKEEKKKTNEKIE